VHFTRLLQLLLLLLLLLLLALAGLVSFAGLASSRLMYRMQQPVASAKQPHIFALNTSL
jgi:hypothetical protein